jgi:hypothetical protein
LEGIGLIDDGVLSDVALQDDGMAENPTEETEGASCAEVGYWFVYELTMVPLDLGTHIFVA